jgi:hypothetical protein
MKSWFVAAVLSFALGASPVLAQTDADVTAAITTNFGDAAPFAEAFDAIREAVAADDAEAFASWISYPFAVTVDGEDYLLASADAVVDHYESMMTDEIRTAILEQQYKDLFVNAEGVMFGNGQLWLSAVCPDESCASFDVRIITVQNTATE